MTQELKAMYPPNIKVMLRKHTVDRLDKLTKDKPELMFFDDTIDFLLSYYEATERIKG